ncbi:MAG: class I SAM-dependent methyltransferase [Deltaproteobacteria bacterium]|nr:class I SAM-dependent methyltransferase [Deltaproteobacteria bacterium]
MQCRFCRTELKYLFVSLGASPLSNAFLRAEDLHKMEPYYPLDVYVCENCLLVQLDEFEKPKMIFGSEYAYFSSYSESWLRHCAQYVDMAVKRFGLNEGSSVMEIASNDGYLLQYFKKYNIPVLGIEPAENTAAVAIANGIPTDVAFFDRGYGQHMCQGGRQADLIIGNNVLAHNPDINDFVGGLKPALKAGGVITMEFPHLVRLVEGSQFDTIYHEHFSYFSLLSVERIFREHGLVIFDVEELPTHGGSLRIYAGHPEDPGRSPSGHVNELRTRELESGYGNVEYYLSFHRKVQFVKRDLLQCLIKLKTEGKRIVGYGAPAKGNTLLNYCGIRTDFLDYTVDRSPHKQNCYLPGSHIPVKHPDRIREDKPEYVLILPWNIKEEIVEQMGDIRQWGGQFIVPIPCVQIL